MNAKLNVTAWASDPPTDVGKPSLKPTLDWRHGSQAPSSHRLTMISFQFIGVLISGFISRGSRCKMSSKLEFQTRDLKPPENLEL